MNRIIVAIITIMMLCPLAQAKNRTVTENDSQGNKKRVIELLDTVIDGKSVTDTLSVTTYEDSSQDAADDKTNDPQRLWRKLGLELACKQPRNHHRRHRHHLCLRYAIADRFHHLLLQLQETESPIPPCRTGIGKWTTATRRFFRSIKSEKDIHTKGISNVFCGIGLFIFLWAITEEFGVACIGLLVMFTGFGQLVIYYTQNPKKQDKEQ